VAKGENDDGKYYLRGGGEGQGQREGLGEMTWDR